MTKNSRKRVLFVDIVPFYIEKAGKDSTIDRVSMHAHALVLIVEIGPL